MSLSSTVVTSSSTILSSAKMIKKPMAAAFYSSKIRLAGPANGIFPSARTLYANDPSDPAVSLGKTPSEFPNRGPGYQPAYPLEMPPLPTGPDLDPLSDPPPNGPGQNPGPDFPVPPSTPPQNPDIPTPKPDWTPPPPGGPSPMPDDPPAGPGVVF